MRISKRQIVVAVGATLLAAIGSARADTPDYVGWAEQFRLVARVETSMRTCENFGYRMGVSSPKEIVSRLVNPAVSAAIRGGIDRKIAQAMLLDAVKTERENQMFVSRHAADGTRTGTDLDAAATTMIDYWAQRCSELADDPFGGRFVIHTSPEAEAAALQHEREMMSRIVSRGSQH